MDAVVLKETDIGNQELRPLWKQPGASRLEIGAADDARDVGQRIQQLDNRCASGSTTMTVGGVRNLGYSGGVIGRRLNSNSVPTTPELTCFL